MGGKSKKTVAGSELPTYDKLAAKNIQLENVLKISNNANAKLQNNLKDAKAEITKLNAALAKANVEARERKDKIKLQLEEIKHLRDELGPIKNDLETRKKNMDDQFNRLKSLVEERQKLRDELNEKVNAQKLHEGVMATEKPMKSHHDWGVVLKMKKDYVAFQTEEEVLKNAASTKGLLLFLSEASKVQAVFETHMAMQGFSASRSKFLVEDMMEFVVCNMLMMWDAFQLNSVLVSPGDKQITEMIETICTSMRETINSSKELGKLQCVQELNAVKLAEGMVYSAAKTMVEKAEEASSFEIASVPSKHFMTRIRSAILLGLKKIHTIGQIDGDVSVTADGKKVHIKLKKFVETEMDVHGWFRNEAASAWGAVTMMSLDPARIQLALEMDAGDEDGDHSDDSVSVRGKGSSVAGSGISGMSAASLKTRLRVILESYKEMSKQHDSLQSEYESLLAEYNALLENINQLAEMEAEAKMKGNLHKLKDYAKIKIARFNKIRFMDIKTMSGDEIHREARGLLTELDEFAIEFCNLDAEGVRVWRDAKRQELKCILLPLKALLQKCRKADKFDSILYGDCVKNMDMNVNKIALHLANVSGKELIDTRLDESVEDVRRVAESIDPRACAKEKMDKIGATASDFYDAKSNALVKVLNFQHQIQDLFETISKLKGDSRTSMINECKSRLDEDWKKLSSKLNERIGKDDLKIFGPILQDQMRKMAELCKFDYTPLPDVPDLGEDESHDREAAPHGIFGASQMGRWPELSLIS